LSSTYGSVKNTIDRRQTSIFCWPDDFSYINRFYWKIYARM